MGSPRGIGAAVTAWFLCSGAARAADRADVAPGRLVIEGEGFTITVTGRGVPLWENLQAGGACRIRFAEQGGKLVSTVKECPEAMIDEVRPASKYWTFETTGDLSGVAFDAWYLADGRGLSTHLGPLPYRVKGDELNVLRLRVSGPTPAYPQGETGAARCAVVVSTGPRGEVTEVKLDPASPCFAPYEAALGSAIRAWTVEPIALNALPLPLVFEAVVAFEPPGDGAPGQVELELPIAPDDDTPILGPPKPPPPLPSDEPLFEIRHKEYVSVRVWKVALPEVPADGTARECPALFQVNSSRRVFLWPEAACHPSLVDPVAATAADWILTPGRLRDRQLYARFRATFVVPAAGAPYLRVPTADLEGTNVTLPEGVRSYAAAYPTIRVPPKLPKDLTVEETTVCAFDVTVDEKGRVAAVLPAAVADSTEPAGCPAELRGPAARSIPRWRFAPAETDGAPFESHVAVTVRFGGSG